MTTRPYDASNRKDIRRAEKSAAERERARVEFITSAMSTIAGRAWFHDFLSGCRLFSDPFTGDALLEAFSKGERNVGLRIYSDIVNNCPQSFVTMMTEASAKDQEDANRRDSGPGSDRDSDPESGPESGS